MDSENSIVSGRKLVFAEAARDVAANAPIRREFGLPPARPFVG